MQGAASTHPRRRTARSELEGAEETLPAVQAVIDAAQTLGVPLHPVQVYESVVCLALFLLLVQLARRRIRDGDIIVAYTGLYAVARFVLEFFRGDADRGFVFGGVLSTSQFIGITMFAVAMAVFLARVRRSV